MTHDDINRRLEDIDACALSDALDSLGLTGAVSGLARRSTRRRVAGRVQTMQLVGTPPANARRVHLGATSIAGAAAGDVLVIEQRTGIDAAGFGGVLANAAKVKGISGVIVDGPARDIDEFEAIDFPVFSRQATTRTARGRLYEGGVNCAVAIGDLIVRAGDYVVADGSGVVFVASSAVEEVLARAENIVAKERLMTDNVLQGMPVTEVMGIDYETMLERQKDSS